MNISPLAGKPADRQQLVNVPELVTAYYTGAPEQPFPYPGVSFGTSGHRGSSLKNSFNEPHILAITQAICQYRQQRNITGPLFLGADTHALSRPAFASVMEVLAANGTEVMIAPGDEYTPTPVVSYAILRYNAGRTQGLADGIILTPSHNPPYDGGYKYNPPHGGPAATSVTDWIEKRANAHLFAGNISVKRTSLAQALKAPTTHRHDYLYPYIDNLGKIIDMNLLRDSKIRIGVDPLGGAGVHYWPVIAEKYGIDLNVVNDIVDPAFGFMTLDWDGQIRMDPSSPYAMQRLIGRKDQFDISFACDTDHDRHAIVAPGAGLLPPNHFLSVMVAYLLGDRPLWKGGKEIGRSVVTTHMIDRIAEKAGRKVYEVPVGFKWFVDKLLDGSLCFAGEESAGAVFSRWDGNVWTTEKDGFVPALLAAEMTARTGKDPGLAFQELSETYGPTFLGRMEAPATADQKQKIKSLSPGSITHRELAGDKIKDIQTTARGNKEPIDGLKVITDKGWFVARPSGTEDLYKVYAESFSSNEHLEKIMEEATALVTDALHT